MFKTIEETIELINTGKLLHISGNGQLLKKLPKGNWIAGSTEYFMLEGGGAVRNDVLDVDCLDFDEYSFKTYGTETLDKIAGDAYDNGFSILILPFDSGVHIQYAQNAANYENIFTKNIVGWISGFNLESQGESAIAVNGKTGENFTDKAVALHIGLPADKIANINIINIFEADEKSPVITFGKDGFSAETCYIDGKERNLAEYIAENNIDTKLPLVGDYSGAGINVSFKNIANGKVDFYAPVFKGINYGLAKNITDYAAAFEAEIKKISPAETGFTCNCILNFLYGELTGKDFGGFYGPITFGEIAWQLVNQTLVYLNID